MVNNSASLEELEAKRLELQRARMRLDSELTATNWELAGEQMSRDGYAPASQTRTASAAGPSSPPRPPKEPLWGKMVRGVKTIVKWVVIAAVAYSAFQIGTGFLETAYPNFYADISTGATDLWKSISSTAVDATKAASEWVGQLFSQNGAGAGTGVNLAHAATTGALTAGVVGTAVHVKQAAAQHAASSVDTNLVGNFPEEIAITGAEKLAAKYTVAAHHAAADHSTHYAMKAAHISTDQTLERLDHRAANLHASKTQSAAERVLNARQNTHSWAEYVDSSRPVGPKGVA